MKFKFFIEIDSTSGSIAPSYDFLDFIRPRILFHTRSIIFPFTGRGVNDTEIAGRDFPRLYTRSGDTVTKGSRKRQGAVAYE